MLVFNYYYQSTTFGQRVLRIDTVMKKSFEAELMVSLIRD